jgi:hypothetical protein
MAVDWFPLTAGEGIFAKANTCSLRESDRKIRKSRNAICTTEPFYSLKPKQHHGALPILRFSLCHQ